KVLRDEGFAAPQIPAADLDQGLLLVEHLGTQGVLDAEGKPVPERYIAAAELLAEMHKRSWPQKIEVARDIVHEIPPYDRRAMGIETELVTDWYLPHVAGRQTRDAERQEFAEAWSAAFDIVATAKKSLVLRD